MAFLDDLSGVVGTVSGNPAAKVTIESSLFPPIVINPLSSDGSGDGSPSLLLRIIKPKITIETPFGTVVQAPAGDPPGFPWVGAIAATGAVLVIILAAKGVRSFIK